MRKEEMMCPDCTKKDLKSSIRRLTMSQAKNLKSCNTLILKVINQLYGAVRPVFHAERILKFHLAN